MDNFRTLPIYSFIYTIPYLILWLFVFMIGYDVIVRKKPNETFSNNKLVTIFLAFLLFFGLRWHIMTDSIAYYYEYRNISPILEWNYIESHSQWWDKGFVVFTMITKLISNDFLFFVFVNSLIDFILLFICIKKYSINIPLSCLLFLSFQGILIEINLFRNIKAILLFIYSLSYINKKQFIKFAICNGIGFTLHASALIYFPMYWILRYRYNTKVIIIFSAVLTTLYLLGNNLLKDYVFLIAEGDNGTATSKLLYYATNFESHVFTLGTIERIGTLILSIYVYNKVNKDDNYFKLFFNSYIIFYALYALFGFNEVLVDRIPTLFYFSYWFLYPYIYMYFKNNPVIRKSILIFLIIKVYMSTNFCTALYENVLFDTSTIYERNILINKILSL